MERCRCYHAFGPPYFYGCADLVRRGMRNFIPGICLKWKNGMRSFCLKRNRDEITDAGMSTFREFNVDCLSIQVDLRTLSR
jgi:hypothetical protein